MTNPYVMNRIGKIDRPIENLESDSFEIGKYITGLSSFISQCDTPMTVAIQGDWGSGKTSFMNLICKKVEKEAATIWFNTWQFSQFNLGNMLTVNLLGALVDQMQDKTDSAKDLKECANMVYHLALSMAEGQMKFKMKDALEDTEIRGGLFTTITKLREKFEKSVEGYLKKQKKSRLVLFIDDLDRLAPGRAVEVLEILKLFLDCKKCVFVLAIDYEVVCRGIREKYGKDMDQEKGRSFFDKIIQVPFKMPVAQYKVEEYLKKNGISEEHAASYKSLIERSIGCNPRGIKRVLNAFQLIRLIYGDESQAEERQDEGLLFAVLCLQLSYEQIYNEMVRNEEELFGAQLFNELRSNTEEEEGESKRAEFQQLVKDYGMDVERVELFMETFCEELAQGAEGISQERCEQLQNVLRMAGTAATVVGNGGSFQNNGRDGTGVRYEYDAGEKKNTTLRMAVEEKTSWAKSKIWSYTIFGETVADESKGIKAAAVFAQVYSKLYFRNPDDFIAAKEKFPQLFKASRGKSTAIPGTEFVYNSDNLTDVKAEAMYRFMSAMGVDPAELRFCVTLRKRIEKR